MEPGLEHSSVVDRIQRSMWEHEARVLHVLVGMDVGTAVVES